MWGLRLVYDRFRAKYQLWYGAICIHELDALSIDFETRMDIE